ncbi:bifunctional ornithine acetyltransferase/N-acetylglutamate synthase [Halobacillus sp. ACCC02827]|uniref:bifunctional ornithine acetyltransferase/N-acetylglutamate synthase n=1 Tax=unclassified Halobacillus TaxID=2636472 RepID=UPI0002A4E4CA|nr:MULTISPECIES: bifunctional ornithine acetyltransferase/N-acetylglutamate synthase [unclassified Halobacillus]ELK46349.1 bifunctional ornithine acetyltransferase/N-acetylglutamate synthase protein [Halobacillus sp. BAB-2008]WJE15582.1 bifunctional ornithine acetyltransferase/N-acetylglutamate synthase [Halobacillus sp. ACCC02827]
MIEAKNVHQIEKLEKGSIVTPKGFTAGGVHCGLRYRRKDFGLLMSETPASIAAVYTQSHFQAPPLKVTQESIAKGGKIQAIAINSAIANACTGEEGMANAYEMRDLIASRFEIPNEYVAVASTGVIGEQLPMDKIAEGSRTVELSEQGSGDFQEAILTTDTCQKHTCYQVQIDGVAVTIAGAAKGSGMIHPNMATMLGFITTDAVIDTADMQAALSHTIDKSFNQITVDGETSTNDMVLALANGKAGHEPLNTDHPDWEAFQAALQLVCEDLAKQIARDGEGATKLIEVNVTGAKSDHEARIIAKKVVGSSLVKTAVYGRDANWGRIVSAIGHSEATLDPNECDIHMEDQLVFSKGTACAFSEEKAAEDLENEKVTIGIKLGVGEGTGTAWGCDLTYDYIKINASYRT